MKTLHRVKSMFAKSSNPEDVRALLITYWQILLYTVFVVMLGVFVYGGWQLYRVMNNDPTARTGATSASSTPAAPVNSVRVDAVLQGFSAKKSQFEIHRMSTTTLRDPSL